MSQAFLKIKLESSSHASGHLVVYTCLHCNSSKGIPAPPTLNLALATVTGMGAGTLEGSTPTAVLGFSESSGSLTMAPPSQSQVRKDEKKKLTFLPCPHPRLLPLTARPYAGHVVFRGNESPGSTRRVRCLFHLKQLLDLLHTCSSLRGS